MAGGQRGRAVTKQPGRAQRRDVILPIGGQRDGREDGGLTGEVVAGKCDGLVEVERVLGGDELEIVVGGGIRDGVATWMHVGVGRLVVLVVREENESYVAFSIGFLEILWRSKRSELVEEDGLQVIQIREPRIPEGDFLHMIIDCFQNCLIVKRLRKRYVLNLSDGNKVRDTQGDGVFAAVRGNIHDAVRRHDVNNSLILGTV